ncbi:MAG: DUF3343 domain-containing protein [Oscillospiraceae bacterium]
MNDYYFTFRSITTAQIGSAALHDAGLPHVLLRTPKAMAWQGCGYSLRVTAARAAGTAQCLRRLAPRTSGSISRPPLGTRRWRWSCDLF